MTMVTIPKSDGVSSRARMTTDPICKAKLPAEPAMAAPAPRTAVRRSPLPVAIGWKVPSD